MIKSDTDVLSLREYSIPSKLQWPGRCMTPWKGGNTNGRCDALDIRNATNNYAQYINVSQGILLGGYCHIEHLRSISFKRINSLLRSTPERSVSECPGYLLSSDLVVWYFAVLCGYPAQSRRLKDARTRIFESQVIRHPGRLLRRNGTWNHSYFPEKPGTTRKPNSQSSSEVGEGRDILARQRPRDISYQYQLDKKKKKKLLTFKQVSFYSLF